MSHFDSSMNYDNHDEDYDYQYDSYESYEEEFTLYGNQPIERENEYDEDDYWTSFKD